MICQVDGCDLEAVYQGTMSTLVGYYSPEGHDHDDNCRTRLYHCGNGHETVIRVRNICRTPGCGWKGKLTCFCHPGEKVEIP